MCAVPAFAKVRISGKARCPGCQTFTNHFFLHMNQAMKNIARLNKIANTSDAFTGAIGNECKGAYNHALSEIALPLSVEIIMNPSILAMKPENAKMNNAFMP